MTADVALKNFDREWQLEVATVGIEQAAIHKCLFRLIKSQMVWALLLLMTNGIFGIVGPIYFLRNLSLYAASTDPSARYGVWLAFGFMLNEAVRSLLVHQYWFAVSQLVI